LKATLRDRPHRAPEACHPNRATEVLIGNGSIVGTNPPCRRANRIVRHANSVAATMGTIVPSGGQRPLPAVIKPGKGQGDFIDIAVQKYVEKGRRFRATRRRID